jgi:hypothetical protein
VIALVLSCDVLTALVTLHRGFRTYYHVVEYFSSSESFITVITLDQEFLTIEHVDHPILYRVHFDLAAK